MIKKILVLLIMIFGINVYASELITINNTDYSIGSGIIEGNNFSFDVSSETLYLTNYVGGPISYRGNLNIVLSGVNVILGNSSDHGIIANNLNIEGGDLYLNNLCYGIYANNINIVDTLIIGQNDLETIYSKDTVYIKDSIFSSQATRFNIHAVNGIKTYNSAIALSGNQAFMLENSKRICIYNTKFTIETDYVFKNLETIEINKSKGFIYQTDNLNNSGKIYLVDSPLYIYDGNNWNPCTDTIIDENTVIESKYYFGPIEEVVSETLSYKPIPNKYILSLKQSDIASYNVTKASKTAVRVLLPNMDYASDNKEIPSIYPDHYFEKTNELDLKPVLEEKPITDPDGEIASIPKEDDELVEEKKDDIEEIEEEIEEQEIQEQQEEQQEEKKTKENKTKENNPKTNDKTLFYVLTSFVSIIVKFTLSFITKYAR